MKSFSRITSMLPKLLLVALFLVLAPAALASTTWYVDGVNGNDNNNCLSPQTACKTIGHAISLASKGDTIMVAPATYTENLTIRKNLKIIGSDAATTIVDGGGVGTVFSVCGIISCTITPNKTHAALSKLTIRDGSGPFGAGGGVSNSGILTVTYSTISGNSAGNGGGIFNNFGATLTITNSTISGNSATGTGGGGGIINHEGGTLTITKSTISGNRSSYGGGGVKNFRGTLTITNSTISGNSAKYAGGIQNYALLKISNSTISGNIAMRGGGIVSRESSVLQNTILANNSGRNCVGTVTSNGYNLSSDKSCNFNGPGDMNQTDAKLGKLGNYGGPTQTRPLLLGSPAIDAGNPNGCTDGNGNLLKTDQRGKPRPDPGDASGCDIGAYERQKN